MSDWIYQGRKFEPPKDFTPDDWYGFVYLISHRGTNRKYVGKKFFWKSKTLPITKTRKRRQRLKVESDWRDYYGSNKQGECAYMETKEQFDREVLLKDEYYNGIINCRIGAKSLKNLFTND